MSSYNQITVGETDRAFTVVAKASGSPITTGTVNYYLKAKSGVNSGNWWRQSDQTWQASETANAMTHDADGHWEITLDAAAFADGVKYLEYVKESGDLHIPDSRRLVARYNVSVDSNGKGAAQVKGMDADTLNASALAADAVTEIQNGLSTFDHTTDEVTTDAASRTASQATGFATPTNVSDAQTAIINAVNAVNTGAARYISIATSACYELPDSGTAVYPVEVRTFDGDGNPVALDAAANPTITVTRTADAADLSANLSAISNPATGVYRCTFTVTTGTDVVGPLQIDASGSIATVTRSTSSYPVITDATAVDFTATDRANLALILEDTGSTLPGLIATAQSDLDILTGTDGVTLATSQPNYAPITAVAVRQEMDSNSTRLQSLVGYFTGITSLASWLGALAGKTSDSSTLAEIQATTGGTTFNNVSDSLEAIRDRGDTAWSGAGGSVTITPLAAGVEQRVSGTNITLYTGEVKATTVSVSDADGNAVDLSALTLEVAIEDHAGTDVQVVADANITVSGASSNNITFTNSAAVTASERVLWWALRDITTGSEVLAKGRINVKRAADGD